MDKESVCADAVEKSQWQDMVEILTPICKAYCSDKGFDVCVKAIQVHGGYGYCHEYKVEQCARDSKITSIYEGTNAIQALDLFGRKVRMKKGAAMGALMEKMTAAASEAKGFSELSSYADEVERAIAALQSLTDFLLTASTSEDAYLAYAWATPYLEIFGDVVLGWMLIWQAAIACRDIDHDPVDKAYYETKVLTAKFYTGSILPAVHGKIEAIYKNDKSLLQMEEAYFSV
jgi:hypothetical protein